LLTKVLAMRRANKWRWLIAATGIALVAVLVAGFFVGRWTKVTSISVSLGVPTPLRFVVLSDIHVGAKGFGVAQTQRCLKMAMAHQPDAILLLGDFVVGRSGIPYLAKALAGIQAPLGVYAVLGNHDHWADASRIAAILRHLGIHLLVNESVLLRKGKTQVVLVGIDDLWAGRPNWRRAFADVPKGVPTILLSHNPDAALHQMGKRANLILAGHTHGGHIWVPDPLRYLFRHWLGRKFIPATEFGWRYPHGLRQRGATFVFVTSGVTLGRTPPRWFTRPEVLVVEVR